MTDNQIELNFNGNPAYVEVSEGLTVREAFEEVADELGLVMSDNITYRSGVQTIPGNTLAVGGAKYLANVRRETKG